MQEQSIQSAPAKAIPQLPASDILTAQEVADWLKMSKRQITLARYFGCGPRTVLRPQDRLTAKGLIAAIPRRGMTNELSINADAIPAEATAQTAITEAARQLALRYQTALKRFTGRKRFPKLWLQHQFFNAQRMVNDCAGDVDKAAKLIGFALAQPEFKKRAAKSLYNLFARWNQPEVCQARLLKV